MPPPPPPPELRPRRLGELLDASVKIWGSNLRVVIPLAAAVELPFQFLSALVERSVRPSLIDTMQTYQKALKDDPKTAVPKISVGQVAALGGSVAISFIATIALAAVMTSIVLDVYAKRVPDRARAVRIALRRGPLMLLSTVLAALLAGVVGGLLAVPATLAFRSVLGVVGQFAGAAVFAWIYIRIGSASPAIVVEGIGPVAVLRRSAALVKGRWWGVFGALTVGTLVTGIPGAIIQAIVNGILTAAGGNNSGFAFVWTAVAATVANALVAPLLATVTVLLYIDLRVRKEGLDVGGLAMPAPAQGSTTT